MDQTNLLENMKQTNDKSRTKTKEGKNKKRNTFDISALICFYVSALYESRELTLNAFRSGIFPIKENKKNKEKD